MGSLTEQKPFCQSILFSRKNTGGGNCQPPTAVSWGLVESLDLYPHPGIKRRPVQAPWGGVKRPKEEPGLPAPTPGKAEGGA